MCLVLESDDVLLNFNFGAQETKHFEMNNLVSKIKEVSRETVDSSSSSCKKGELCSDMLMWLRTAALDPCKPKQPLEKLRRRQILKAREYLSLDTTKFSWKNRKLILLQKKSAVTSSPPLAKPNGHSYFASSVSRLINSTDSPESSQRCHRRPPISVGSSRYRESLSRKRVCNSDSYESDGSISVASTAKKPTLQTIHRVTKLLKPINNLPLKRVCMLQAKITNKNISPLSNSDDLVDNSSRFRGNDSVDYSSTLNDDQMEYKTSSRSRRLQNFIGDYLPRLAIPVGPRFQADIPDWIEPRKNDNSSTDNQSDSFDSRYLGTKIWPIEGKNIEDSKEKWIGKGRSYSCSCTSMGSISCIKLHIFEKGCQLRADLGSAFFTWKFDEMGEEVSKSWTVVEQQCFESLVKTNRLSQTDSFLVSALKQLSRKCRKSILSYYFNVFILRRMSKKARLATELVDSEDDDDNDDDFRMESSPKRKSTKYLSHGR
ncbi:hypothetical protein MKX01_016403 [Papaver californicum]|nr:hypothetical protein MKX01_016403 [Papaver californicum]